MPGSGKHNVGNIDSFFKVRPSRLNVREGEVISFLEDGNLVKQEKRNGVIYQSVFVEQGKKEKEATTQNQTSSTAISGAISSVSAGTGLSGGGTSGAVTLNVSGVLEDFNTLGAPASDGQFIVATGSGAFAYESGTTVRTSLGLGNLATLDTISNSQVASDASIATSKLAANSITVSDGSTSTAIALGSTATFSGTTNEIEVSESSGTITVGLPNNVTISGNLTVSGSTVTVDADTLTVEDPLIKLAKDNGSSDAVDIGLYGLYDTSGTDKYAGLFRDASDSGKFKLFKDLQAEPTTTVNVSGTGYAKATLVADLEGNVTGNATGNAGTATALATGRDISLTGDVTGTTNTVFDGTGNVSIAASIADNSVDLTTHTTGNYVATLTAGNLIDLQNNTGEGATPTIDVDLSELSTSTSDGDGDFFAVVDSSNAQKKLTKGNINLSGFNNDSGFTSNAGTVTSITVTGGDGLTGGGSAITSSGSVTLAVGSSSLAVSSNAVDIAYSALSTISDDIETTDHIIFFDASNSNAVQIGTVSDLPFTNTSGTVTNVVAGAGLTGGGTTSATLDVGAGTGISVATNSVSTNDSEIVHDNLSGFVANEHIDHSGVSITAGNGLTGGGTIASTRTLAVGAGDGIAVNANDVEVDFSGLSVLNTDVESLTSQDTVVVYNQSADAIVQLSVDDIGGGAVSAVANGADNRIATFSSSTALNGESTLTWNGSDYLNVQSADGAEGGIRLKKSSTDATHTQYSISHRDDNQTLIIYSYDGTTFRNWITLDEPNALLKLGSNSSALSQFDSNGDFFPFRHIDMGDDDRIKLGDSDDLQIVHASGINFIHSVTSNVDIRFRVNDGGSDKDAIIIDSSEDARVKLPNDNQYLSIGASGDLYFYHDSSNSIIRNATGDLILRNDEADKDIILQTDDGSDGVTPYITLDGSATRVDVSQDLRIPVDNKQFKIGAGEDLLLYHDGNTHIQSNTAPLIINQVANSTMEFKTNNTSAMIINASQNVGIGTSNTGWDGDADNLVVGSGSGNNGMTIYAGSSSFSQINFADSNSGAGRYTGIVRYNHNTNDMSFHTNDGTVAMTIDDSQNIGIGITSPSSRLHISENGGSTDDAFEVSPDNGGNRTMTINGEKINVTTTNGGSAQELVLNDNGGDISIGGKMQFPASHSADKIVMYKNGNEKIGTEANTLLFTGANHVFHDTSNNDMMKITSDGLRVDDILGLSNGTNRLVLDDDTRSGLANGVSLTGVNTVYICCDETNNGTGEIQFLKGTDNDLDAGTAVQMARIDNNSIFYIDDIYSMSNNNNRLILDDDTNSSQANGVSLTGANHVYLCPDETNNNTGDVRIITGTNNDLDSGTATEIARIDNSGNAHFDADVVAFSSTVSDKRLKENITTIQGGLDKVLSLRGVEYDWTATSRKGEHDIGLIAQEVEKVIPEVVVEHDLCTGEFGLGKEKTFKTVDYEKIVGVLIEAIKEQQQKINKLEEKLNG